MTNDLLGIDAKTMMLYGNYDSNDIIRLGEQFYGNIIVASNDYIYTDQLYKMLKSLNANINVVCLNLLTETSDVILKELYVDVIVINERFNDLSHLTANSAYKLVMRCHDMCKYLYVADREILNELYSKGFASLYEKTRYSNIWKSI